jgi:hypothetical protein
MVSRVRAADARGRDEAVRCSPAHDMRRRSGRLQGRLERLAVLRWVTDPKDIRPNESSWPACLSLQTLLNLNQGSPVPARMADRPAGHARVRARRPPEPGRARGHAHAAAHENLRGRRGLRAARARGADRYSRQSVVEVKFRSSVPAALSNLEEAGLGWRAAVAAYTETRVVRGYSSRLLMGRTMTEGLSDRDADRVVADFEAPPADQDLSSLGQLLVSEWIDETREEVPLLSELTYDGDLRSPLDAAFKIFESAHERQIEHPFRHSRWATLGSRGPSTEQRPPTRLLKP